MQENISQMKHTFSEIETATAQALIRIFETGKPSGNYAAFAVLNDGAGVSYGISQFTHRSGSLREVLERYLKKGGVAGREIIEAEMPLLKLQNVYAIRLTASNSEFKNALVKAAATAEMRSAQDEVAFERYLQPAINACTGSGFVLPLSLAVIYDSMTHGSYHLIRDRVRLNRSGLTAIAFEKAWVTEYVLKRDAWLNSIPRLRPTRYRMRFFLDQIATGRWQLEPPLNVNGVKLTKDNFNALVLGAQTSAAEPYSLPANEQNENAHHKTLDKPATPPQARQPIETTPEKAKFDVYIADSISLGDIESFVDKIASRYDRIERIARSTSDRSDRAKSLWTTIAGTLWQTAWALFGFVAGLPREVWLIVAIIAAVLMLAYLYRQIRLGQIRETKTANSFTDLI